MPIDYSKYPPNWKTEIRPRILARAKDRCEFCFVLDRSIGYWYRGKFVTSGALISDFHYYRNYKRYDKKTSLRMASTNRYRLIEIILTVMHLDQDPENWNVQDDRLKAACQRCHLAYDKKDNQNKRKYGKDYKLNQISLPVGAPGEDLQNLPHTPSGRKLYKKYLEMESTKTAPTVPTVPTEKHTKYRFLVINYLYISFLKKIIVILLERVGTCWNAASWLDLFQQKNTGSNRIPLLLNIQVFNNQLLKPFVGLVGTVGAKNRHLPFRKINFL